MRIEQAYVSKSVEDFPFRDRLSLTEYVDQEKPALFIGCYNQNDLNTIKAHNGKAVVLWCGQDALECIMRGFYQSLKNCIHVTWLTNVEKALRNFLPVKIVSPLLLGGEFTPSEFGNKIFAYAPASFPDYHRIDLIRELIKIYPQYEFIIGDGSITQNKWLNGVGNSVYDQCFIGLALSGFAGGGQTVIQMGLKGRCVVTNVVNSPNACFWGSMDDIKKIIDKESQMIGQIGNGLANLVRSQISKYPTWLEI